MTDLYARLDEHIDSHLDHYLSQLGRLCGQPSVSAQNLGIAECAELVASMLSEEGYSAEIMPSDGFPVVYGETSGASEKTLLLYLHYDVQPPEPLDLWDSPPFKLTRRGDRFYARGVSDDKGHIITRLAALAAVRDVLGGFPCRIKWVVEGEEEIGSPSMEAFVARNRDKLAADACIWEFGGVDFAGNPTLTLGMRGIFYVELSVRTAAKDAHSGLGGSLFANAAWRLTWALNTLKGSDERVRIPGFYDDVRQPSERDLALLAQLPDQFADLRKTYAIDGFLKGEIDPLKLQRMAVFEPTCTICGLTSGYQGPGSKTVQPAEARAKVDFRLVPDQDPADIAAKLRAHLDAEGFSDVAIKVFGGERPAKVDPDDPFVRLAAETATSVYGRPPIVEPIIGGSGPLHPFVAELGVPVVSAGIGYPGGQAHAPNEHIVLEHLRNGIRHTARLIAAFAGQ